MKTQDELKQLLDETLSKYSLVIKKNEYLVLCGKTQVLSVDKEIPPGYTDEVLHSEDYIKVMEALAFLLLNKDLPELLRKWAAYCLNNFSDELSVNALSYVYLYELPGKPRSRNIHTVIMHSLELHAYDNEEVFDIFIERLFSESTGEGEIDDIIDMLEEMSAKVPQAIIALKNVVFEAAKRDERFTAPEYFAFCSLLEIAKRDVKEDTIAKDAVDEVTSQLRELLPHHPYEYFLEQLKELAWLYEPLKDESSDPDISSSDEDEKYARQSALTHINEIIDALGPTSDEKIDLYKTATSLAKEELNTPGQSTFSRVNKSLSHQAKQAIQEVAQTQVTANCRHNPILRTAIILSRRKTFSSGQRNIGFNSIGDGTGRIVNEQKQRKYSNALYEAVRKAFPEQLRNEFQRLQKKYNFTRADFNHQDTFARWQRMLSHKLDHNVDLIALHHIAYKDKQPRFSVSTRNLEVVTDWPRSPQPNQHEGTHSANHRMMAAGDNNIMKVQSPQVLSAYQGITNLPRQSKKKFIPAEVTPDGYSADDELEGSTSKMNNLSLNG